MTMTNKLADTAQMLVAPGLGILAADESTGTIKKRLAAIDVESTEETRRGWRELLFTTGGIEEYISGVIMFDETIRQKTSEGTPFPEYLFDRGILPGIKVDRGAKALAGAPGEKVTEGLDGLRERLAEYVALGARFTKWRAVITIGIGMPTRTCIDANAHALARFAALSQEAGLVPIVEPEVLMDGNHEIAECERVTELTIAQVYTALRDHGVILEGTLLKPNMVLPGLDCPNQVDVDEVAARTLVTLRRVVPAAVPGVVFLSGGQTAQMATAHLNAMNTIDDRRPWELSFSYGRALQQPALTAWNGKSENVPAAQQAFRHRALCNSAARRGECTPEMEAASA
jgi:fructose-bisphosphate aldolase class I